MTRHRPRHRRRRHLGVKLAVVTLVAVIGSVYGATSASEQRALPLRSPRTGASTRNTTVETTTAPTPEATSPSTTSSPTLSTPGAATSDAPAAASHPPTTRPPAPRRAIRPASPATAPVLRARPHVMVIMMENETFSSVIGNASLPYLNGTLAAHYLVLQQAFAAAHPSLPNYLDLMSGSTWGATSDCAPGPQCQGDTNFPAQLDGAGISWAGYMESMPGAGYAGGNTGDDGYGDALYVQHHNPFVYFPDLAGDVATHVKPLTSMMSDLNGTNPPSFVWVSPNMLDDMHDGPLTTADTWLSEQIPGIQSTTWYRAGGTIILLWDEGQDADTTGIAGGDGGHVPGIVISQALGGAAPDTTPVDDAGILRSIEQLYGLAYLNGAADPSHGSVPGL